MLEFGGNIYYIDLNAIDKSIVIENNDECLFEEETKTTLDENGKVVLTEVFKKKINKAKQIDSIKYDLLKDFIDYIIEYENEALEDDSLGSDRALGKAGLQFKIVFNTLLNEKIIKEIEE